MKRSEANGVTTVFVYDTLGRMVAEYSSHSEYKGTRYLTRDHLGSTRVVTDAGGNAHTEVGAKGSRHDYLPFGEEVGVGGRSQSQGYALFDGVRQRFAGHERDDDGLDYMKARYYSPTTGRFTSPDVLFADQREDDPQSWNLYTYVGNNPLLFTDPTGLWKWVDEEYNGRRFLQWEEGDDWKSLALFLNRERGNTYSPIMLEEAFGGGPVALGPDMIVDTTGAVPRWSSTRGLENTSFETLSNITPAGGARKIGGGILARLWRGVRGMFGKKAAAGAARKSVREISEELGYFPSGAVKDALIGKVPLESIAPAERKIAAEFYERVANEVGGTQQDAARALNQARARFLREGGEPPGHIHSFKDKQ